VLLPILSQTRDTSHTRSSYPGMPNSMACTTPLFVAISCSGGDLTIDANSQSAVASQLRRHIHDVIVAGDGPSVLLTSEHVIPVLILS